MTIELRDAMVDALNAWDAQRIASAEAVALREMHDALYRTITAARGLLAACSW